MKNTFPPDPLQKKRLEPSLQVRLERRGRVRLVAPLDGEEALQGGVPGGTHSCRMFREGETRQNLQMPSRPIERQKAGGAKILNCGRKVSRTELSLSGLQEPRLGVFLRAGGAADDDPHHGRCERRRQTGVPHSAREFAFQTRPLHDR